MLIMMQSLLRLLLLCRNASDPLDLPSSAPPSARLESVRNTFVELVKSLDDETSVVCVIDGLQAYCDRSSGVTRKREAEETLPHLIRMASMPQMTQCRFKLLLTASKKSLAERLSRDCGIGVGGVQSIGHGIPDQQGLRPRFCKHNPLTWA